MCSFPVVPRQHCFTVITHYLWPLLPLLPRSLSLGTRGWNTGVPRRVENSTASSSSHYFLTKATEGDQRPRLWTVIILKCYHIVFLFLLFTIYYRNWTPSLSPASGNPSPIPRVWCFYNSYLNEMMWACLSVSDSLHLLQSPPVSFFLKGLNSTPLYVYNAFLKFHSPTDGHWNLVLTNNAVVHIEVGITFATLISRPLNTCPVVELLGHTQFLFFEQPLYCSPWQLY